MRSVLIVMATLLVVATGCSRTDRLTVVPAAGKVMLKRRDGKLVPMDGAHVVFVPLAGEGRFQAFPAAHAGADGSFRLGTFGTDDGAPEGEYVVTLEWKERYTPKYDAMGRGEVERGPDKLNGAYADRNKSPLRATVTAGQELTIIVSAP